jgi:hypothetical protein
MLNLFYILQKINFSVNLLININILKIVFIKYSLEEDDLILLKIFSFRFILIYKYLFT